MNHTHARRLIYTHRCICISNRKIEFMHIVVVVALITYSFFLSPHLSLSFHSTTTPQAFNEWKKISFGLYMRLCVFNIIFLFYISWALFCFLLTSQFSSALRFVQTRGEISRLLRNLFKTFCFAFCYFTILFFY